ncbi:MAG: RusA family crossover junction endodeoxyribonuclease [Phycisphaerales bacterium]|nr:RusA family crossover junction endodeoxyribonuclease [Phycisphaerales bacterium]
MSTLIQMYVPGTPVSFRAKRDLVHAWRQKVGDVARKLVAEPIEEDDLVVRITHFYRCPPRCDADNMSKPICDALSRIAYFDDRQIVECTSRRIPLGRAFRLGGMPHELAVALCEGDEFVYIQISRARMESWHIWNPQPALAWT